MATLTQRGDGTVAGCGGAVPAAGGGGAFPPPGFVDVAGAAAFFGISSGQLYDRIRNGRLTCRGELVNGPNGKRGRIWPIAELERAREAMANPDGWVPGEEAQALFGVSRNTWNHWVKDKRVPQGRWGHGSTGKRCLLFPLDALQRLKVQQDEEKAQAQRALDPYPDPDRPGTYRLPVASDKHKGMEALIDAADLPLARGKRWNWSGGRADGSGASVCRPGGASLPRLIMGVADDPERLVCYVNGNSLDCRRENLIVRTRSEVAKARRPRRKWERGYEPYVDPDRPSVVRVPILTEKHKGMEALIDAADLPLVQGKRWHWSPGKPDPTKDGSVVVAITGTPKPTLTRILLGIEDPEQLVCHRNGNRLDCRRENLVVRNRQQVKWASKKVLVKGGKESSSRFKGVTRSESGRKWYAAISVDGAWRRLGRFRSEIDAALAYDAALREVMGEDVAGLNFPDPAEVERFRALEPVVEDGPFPPPGMVDRHEACAMFGVSTTTWIVWERRRRITCGQYHPLPNDKPGRCKLYPKAELERLRAEIEKLGKPYADPDRPGVWRVPLKGYLAYREALIDEADLPVVQGKNWNWSGRSEEGRSDGSVILATTGPTVHLHRLIAGVTDPKLRVCFANGDPLDLRRENLVVRTLAESNHTNRKMETRAGKACTSKFKGVYHDVERDRWVAQIRKSHVYQHIGRFRDEMAAAQAYDDCSRVLFGPHAYVNFPDRESSEQDRAWAQRVMDGTAKKTRARRRRLKRLERKLRWAALDAKRNELSRTQAERDALRAARDASPRIGRAMARKLFGVSRRIWKRWQRLGWLPALVTVKEREGYALCDVEGLLHACGRKALPYPDPERPGVYRVPLSGKTSRGREALIDADAVPLVQTRRWRFAPSDVGRGGEVQTMNPAEGVRLHYVVMGVLGSADSADEPFHIGFRNDDPLDCRRENLVLRTLTDTAANKRKQATFRGRPCTSRFKGVCWVEKSGKWFASIKKNRVRRRLGYFRDEIAAAQAYDEAARELFGEHARLNFPEGVDAWLERAAA